LAKKANSLYEAIYQKKLYCFNVSPWRKYLLEPYFKEFQAKVFLCSNLQDAIYQNIDDNSFILIFNIKEFEGLNEFAKQNNIPVVHMEDGFIRSVNLGSSFTRPTSIILDFKGIYFDPNQPSDLENILQNYKFDQNLINRAKKLKELILNTKLSKYNHLRHKTININKDKYDKIILVPGQVDDDRSVLLGGYGFNNKKLLETVRKNNPNSFIIYKPHPDVLSGNRNGHIPKTITQKNANLVVTDISIDSCIQISDEIHTISSTSGFDALIRGKKVYTYGMPFYAGWGLTTDFRQCVRRTRKLNLEELIAGTLILYPIYLSPKTYKISKPEIVLKELKEIQDKYFNNKLYKFYIDMKGFILPKLRRMYKKLTY